MRSYKEELDEVIKSVNWSYFPGRERVRRLLRIMRATADTKINQRSHEVFRLIAHYGVRTRAQISKEMRLSQQAIHYALQLLLNADLIEQSKPENGGSYRYTVKGGEP